MGKKTGLKCPDEAFIAMLSAITQKDVAQAEATLTNQILCFDSDEGDLGGAALVAQLCVELAKIEKANESERRDAMARVSSLAGKLKSSPNLSETERSLYLAVKGEKRADFLLYLAKCFGVVKDRERRSFVLDLIDAKTLSDAKEAGEYVAMLFSEGKEEKVRDFLLSAPALDGDTILPLFLEKFTAGSQKQTILLSIADKISFTDAIEEPLNAHLSECTDLEFALSLVDMMTKNQVNLSPTGFGGVLKSIKDPDMAKRVLNNYGKRALSGLEVDMLVSFATAGDGVANEVLRHLKQESQVNDLGSANMRLLVTKCNLANIKERLFEFALDKKLAENLLIDAIRGHGADRLSTIRILSGFVPSIDLQSYSATLLGRDELKKEIIQIVAPKTGKFVSANRVIEDFLQGGDDSEDKREIFEMFGEFPFSEKALSLYLSLAPKNYYEQYENWLFSYLDSYPENARTIFIKQYEKLIEGYERVLPRILSKIKYMDNNLIIRFMLDFRGAQATKDELFSGMTNFLVKPKHVEVDVFGTRCNLLQAYLLTMNDPSPTTQKVVLQLRQLGLKPDEKVISDGKKHKMHEYVSNADLKPQLIAEINQYLK